MHTETEEMQRRMFNYEILHGTFYKYMYKAVDNEGLRIIFYHNNHNKLIKFSNIVNEQQFKDIFNKEIEKIVSNKNVLEIYFKNESCIQIIYGNENSRGHRYNYAIVDKDINKEVCDCIIKPACIPYSHNSGKKTTKLKYNCGIEFLDFNC